MPEEYKLPELPFKPNGLEPYMSEEQIKLHHDKHHQSYVNNANEIIAKLESARKDGSDLDMKSVLKSLSFNLGGHILHSLFWATGYNVIAIPLAAGVLAAQGVLLEPAVGAILMSVSTIIVAFNALLLRRAKLS